MAEQETFTREGLYVRKSTGLVREVSPFSALLFNILPTVPGVGLAVSVFFALGVFPGAHIISAYWLTGLIALAIALPFAFLATAFARSGGDYILVSRSLGRGSVSPPRSACWWQRSWPRHWSARSFPRSASCRPYRPSA